MILVGWIAFIIIFMLLMWLRGEDKEKVYINKYSDESETKEG